MAERVVGDAPRPEGSSQLPGLQRPHVAPLSFREGRLLHLALPQVLALN